MIYCVLFGDDPKHAEMRQKHLQAHLAFLKGIGRRLHTAGPLRNAASGAPAGGLRVVEAQNADAVRARVEADPFWPTGLRKSMRILEWTQVVSNG